MSRGEQEFDEHEGAGLLNCAQELIQSSIEAEGKCRQDAIVFIYGEVIRDDRSPGQQVGMAEHYPPSVFRSSPMCKEELPDLC